MKSLTKRERIFMAIISLWLFINIVVYFMSKPVGKEYIISQHEVLAKSILYPFGAYYWKDNEPTEGNYIIWYKITEVYDFTELLIYGIFPFVLFGIYKVFLKNKNQ